MLPQGYVQGEPKFMRSITEVRMDPYPTQGYGRLMNWHYEAVKIARKKKESCEHMDRTAPTFTINNVLITMSPIEDGLSQSIKFKVSCAQCPKVFALTSDKLSKQFNKFYKRLNTYTSESEG